MMLICFPLSSLAFAKAGLDKVAPSHLQGKSHSENQSLIIHD